MAAKQRNEPTKSLTVTPDRPLIGIFDVENGVEVVRYFAVADERDPAAVVQSIEEARSLAGAWADLDWQEALDELDRIRHDSPPTPPIDEL